MRILVVPDIHEPVAHGGALDFMDHVAQIKQPDTVVFIGDVVDHHGISTWLKHPAAPGPKDEYELALAGVQQWYKRFPDATVCIGNHDDRPVRIAAAAGVMGAYLKDYATVWQTPRWNWVDDLTLLPDDEAHRVYFTHGAGRSGMNPAWNLSKDMGMSSCMGHVHSVAGCRWDASPVKRKFGLDVGALIDDKLYAFAYGKAQKKKSVLGCGFIDTHNPLDTGFLAMPCGPGEQFSRENYPYPEWLRGRLA